MNNIKILLSTAVLFSLTHTVWPAADAVTPFRSNAFITDWLVCGPFPNEKGETIDSDFLSEHGGESSIIPQAGLSHRSSAAVGGAAIWRPVQADSSGKLDLGRCLSPNQKNIAYAAAVLQCAQPTYAILKVGSNDRIKIWLNGRPIHYYALPRSSGPDADHIQVSLNQGKNLLLAKVDQEGGGWFLYARLEALIKIDERLWVLSPCLSPTQRKTETGQVADLISVPAFNMSDETIGPVSLLLKSPQGALFMRETKRFIEPRRMIWLEIEAVTGIEDLKKTIQAQVIVQHGAAQKTFKIFETRQPIVNGQVYLVPGFHVDPVWVDSQAGFQAKSFSNVDQNLRAMEVDSSYEIFLHEIPYLKPYYDAFPGDRALIRRMVQQGRIATGGSYNQPNETTISGEALIRNILYGRLFHERVLGDYPRAYAPWDVFGHIIQLPQILAKSEFIGTAFTRSNYREPEVRVPDVPDLYWAVAPDGSKLLTRKVNYGFDWRGSSYDLSQSARKKAASMLKAQQQQIPGIASELILEANDEKPPTAWMIGRSKEFKQYLPPVHFSANGQAEYFSSILEQDKQTELDIPELSRDESQYNEGCELSRFDLKMGNRLCENTLVSAEKFATMADLLGSPYPAAEMDKAWRQVLFGQHHDAITGCGADVPFLDLMAGYHEALELSAQVLKDALHYIAARVQTETPDHLSSLVVFNPLNWTRSDVVRARLTFSPAVAGFEIIDANGCAMHCVVEKLQQTDDGITSAQVLFMAKEVPSIGYQTFWVKPSATPPPVVWQRKTDVRSIENDFYRLTVDEKMGGGIVSLVDKRTGNELINTENGHPGNEVILLKEGSGFEPAWRFLTTGEKYFSKDTQAQVEVFENALFKRIRVEGPMPRLRKRIQEITLYNELERIDFRTCLVDYEGLQGGNIPEKEKHSDRDFYCIGFPTLLQGNVPVLEDRFAVKSYFPGKEYLTYHSTNREWTSHHAMNSCYQWMDFGHSVTVRCGDSLAIALGPVEIITPRNKRLRQAGFELQRMLAQKGVTATPGYDRVQRDYDIQYRRFSFSIGALGQNHYSEKLLKRLPAVDLRRLQQEIRQNGYAYALCHDTALPEAWFKLPVLLIVGADEANTEKGVTQIIQQLRKNHDILLPAAAVMLAEKATVPQQGLALLNRGNIAGCVEPEGSMILGLFHAVPWQGPLLHWTHDFPERKTHVFDYALMPHRGDWRSAGLVRHGYDFNNPLIAVEEKPHKGPLPSFKSFLRVTGKEAIITAVKPRSAGVEGFQRTQATEASQGVVVRLYEPHGDSGRVSLVTDHRLLKAQRVNLMERQASAVSYTNYAVDLPLSANTIETVLIALSPTQAASAPAHPAAAAPAFVRYWEQNEGAAPTGYLPVSVRLIGAADGSHNSTKLIRRIQVAVTNDYIDSAVQGTIKIETPPEFRALPEAIPYSVPANGERFYPVTLVTENAGQTPGFIKASIEQDGRVIYDVLELAMPAKTFGHAEPLAAQEARLEWNVAQDKNEIAVHLKNPFNQTITGRITLIGPCETWGLELVNPISLAEFTPWQQPFSLPAGGATVLTFTVQRTPNRMTEEQQIWAAAKLSYMGFVEYKEAIGHLAISR